MSIAEKLTTVAENQQKVYDAGFEDGKAEGGVDHLLYAVTFPSFTAATFPDGYDMTINMPNFSPPAGAFAVFGQTKGLRRLKLMSSAVISGLNMTTVFSSSSIEELDLSEFPRNITAMASTFLHCRSLQKILGELDLTKATFNGYEFFNCEALEEIHVKPLSIYKSVAFAQSSKLYDESIQSIIDGLADLTGQTSQKVSFHTDVLLKLTDEQFTIIASKNWTT